MKESTIFEEEEINLTELIPIYTRHWKWFLLSILFFLFSAWVFLKNTAPIYQITSTILVKNKDQSSSSFSQSFESLGLDLGGGTSANLLDEIEILHSKTLLEQIIVKNQYNISYFDENQTPTLELFQSPIKLILLGKKENFLKVNGIQILDLSFTTDSQFSISTKFHSTKGSIGKVFSLGEFGKALLVPTGKKSLNNRSLSIHVSSIFEKTLQYQEDLTVEPLNEKGNILALTLLSASKEKAIQFIDKLTDRYNSDAITEQRIIDQATSIFLDERIAILTADLAVIEKNSENFKNRHHITELKSVTGILLNTANEFRKKSVEAEMELNVMQHLSDYISDSRSQLIPTNIGLNDIALTGMITTYNQTLLERNQLLSSSSNINPVVLALNNQLGNLKGAINQSLSKQKSAQRITLNGIKKEENKLSSKISAIPKQERIFRTIQRQQEIKESLYLFLLTKREENAISTIVIEPSAKIIDKAYAQKDPVSPNKKIVLVASLLLGFLVPFSFIYITDLFDDKIRSKKDIEKVTNTPIYGLIPKNESDENIVVTHQSISPLSEAFRILRNSIDLTLKSRKNPTDTPVLFITSTITQEGKSFLSANLAATYALSGKKTLFVGMDIRNPKVGVNLKLKEGFGVINYLIDHSLTIDKIIHKNTSNNLDVILSGPIPPNPGEILLSDRVNQFFEEIKQLDYDILIIDTAPTAPVVDTSLIAHQADCILYTLRSEYTLTNFAQNLEEFKSKLQTHTHLGIVLNAVEMSKGYGYGYTQQKNASWFEKLKEKF